MLVKIKNELPPMYRDWFSLYKKMMEIWLPEHEIFTVVENNTEYEFNVNFVKSKAMDEIYPKLPTRDFLYKLKSAHFAANFDYRAEIDSIPTRL